ncbi:hypothetical protein MRB53_009759 [Persea americana]|uniref:Uncharacterized protein n=1 Tax=Persea americana TaxID=3435 RepID=A0ACC2LQY6_PERAE|nr:hypothetical protein MRB53_009759 [Persea americana]
MVEFHLYLFLSSETGNLMHGSISTDSVSINEKNELKDNLNANNLNLELEVVKPEMVEPSSRDVAAIGGDLHSLGDQEPGENWGSMEEIHDTNAATADLIKKNESTDAGSPEKLNLDPSKGDDSLEEDVLDSKQIDSNHNSDEVIDRNELMELPVVKEGSVDVAMEVRPSPGKRVPDEENHNLEISSEKRKLDGMFIIISTCI